MLKLIAVCWILGRASKQKRRTYKRAANQRGRTARMLTGPSIPTLRASRVHALYSAYAKTVRGYV